MITIHGMATSGNCYKPRLLLALLDRPFRHVEVNAVNGETRRPEWLAMNPNGKTPLMQLADGQTLAESNAILFYLGETTPFIPDDRLARARMLQWMFFEQYSHEPHIAVRRALLVYPERRAGATPERLAATLEGGHKALLVMERQLAETSFLVGETPSLADIALYAYTHTSDQGGFDLAKYPSIRRWLAAIAVLPSYRPMDWLPEIP